MRLSVCLRSKRVTRPDFADMLENYKTFDEAIEDKSLSIMVRQRLKQVRALVFEQLDLATVI